jgi:hypothetical protein
VDSDVPFAISIYVASTGDNEIFAISNAGSRTGDGGTGKVVYQDNAHLRGPLGLVLAPNGDLIAANGDAVNGDPTQTSELVEFTPGGKFVDEFSIDPTAGGAFGLAVSDAGGLLRLAAVEDVTNSVDVWTFQSSTKSPDAAVSLPAPGSPPAATSPTAAGSGAQALPVTTTVAIASSGATTDPSAGSSSTSEGQTAGTNHKRLVGHFAVFHGRHARHSALLTHRHSRGPRVHVMAHARSIMGNPIG